MSELPLSARVTAPATAVPMAVSGISWRAATLDDVDALMELYAATSAADHPSFCITREELVAELGHSYLDLGRDTLVGVDDATGALVALGAQILLPGQETLVRSIVEGAGVHPDFRDRGIGRALLGWHEQRGLQQLASSDKTLPGWLLAWVDDRAEATGRILGRFDFAPKRWFLGLTRDLSEPIPEVALAGGIRIEPFSLERSAAAHAAKDAAFRDHWGSQPTTTEQWDEMVGLDIVRFEHSFVAVDADDDVVGVLLTWVVEEDWPRQGYTGGYVGIVGVVKEQRKKGLASALLTANFRSLRAAGLERCDLDVDSDSPTGALGLYTGLGFTEHSRSANFVKEF